MDNAKTDLDVIIVIYSLILKYNLSVLDIYDMSINDRTKLELFVLGCVCTLKLDLAVEDYMSITPRVTLFLTKYCGALQA